MVSYPRDDWRFGLTSTFVLEFVARAAMANIHPALLADIKDWNNVYFALGHTPTAPKYLPRSVNTATLLARLRDVLPAFTPELEGFAAQHINRRNEELHAGTTPFDGLTTTWLASFYLTCQVLLEEMGQSLEMLVGTDEAKLAQQMIAASRDQSAKVVARSIAAHKTVWESKGAEEKIRLQHQSAVWATRQEGHRVNCPSCGSAALVVGAPVSPPIRKLDGDLIVETQDYLPARFECVACQLKITGLSQLTACGLGTIYKSTSNYDAAAYYAQQDDYRGYEEDNNEP
ncbi:MAG: hypothetical protein L6Q99_18615 [Planctomycetes bacterium]|nr:hypothetical protein [Planctomycetota bacterium]